MPHNGNGHSNGKSNLKGSKLSPLKRKADIVLSTGPTRGADRPIYKYRDFMRAYKAPHSAGAKLLDDFGRLLRKRLDVGKKSRSLGREFQRLKMETKTVLPKLQSHSYMNDIDDVLGFAREKLNIQRGVRKQISKGKPKHMMDYKSKDAYATAKHRQHSQAPETISIRTPHEEIKSGEYKFHKQPVTLKHVLEDRKLNREIFETTKKPLKGIRELSLAEKKIKNIKTIKPNPKVVVKKGNFPVSKIGRLRTLAKGLFRKFGGPAGLLFDAAMSAQEYKEGKAREGLQEM